MHDPHHLLRNAQENFGIVLMFAFAQPALRLTINEKFTGNWEFLKKLACEVPERRADRALLELAIQLRAMDDIHGLSAGFQRQEKPAIGHVVQQDGSTSEPLYFRDMTNKILHAGGFRWELADLENPTVVCVAGDRWKEAHVRLVVLMNYLGGLGF